MIEIARTVVTSQAAEAEALQAVESARANTSALRERAAVLDASRALIAERRRDGDLRDDDAGQVALLDMDRADIGKLLAEAETAEAAMLAQHGVTLNAMAAAQNQAVMAEQRARAAALAGHAAHLAELLERTLGDCATLAAQMGPGEGAVMNRDLSKLWQSLEGVLLASIATGRGAVRGQPHGTLRWKPPSKVHDALLKLIYGHGDLAR